MGWLKDLLTKLKPKIKFEISMREAITTWRASSAYAFKKDKKLKKLLSKGKLFYSNIRFRENNNYSLLHQAITDKEKDVIKLILDQQYANEILDDNNNSLGLAPIQLATIYNDLDLFVLLEDKGANPSIIVEQTKIHLLHLASHYGSLKVLDYIFKKYFSKSVDVLSSENWTPCHYACFQNKMDVVSYLIENGCNLQLRNKQEMTPLDLAIQQDHVVLCQALYEFHYDKAKLSKLELSKPVHIAATSKVGTKCLEYFLNDPNNINEICDTKIKGTPLHFASITNNLAAVKVLCRYNAVINCKDYLGNTPLFYAVENDNEDIIKVLHDYGADGNIKNEEGLDPYQIAIYNQKEKARKYFLGNQLYRFRNIQNFV